MRRLFLLHIQARKHCRCGRAVWIVVVRPTKQLALRRRSGGQVRLIEHLHRLRRRRQRRMQRGRPQAATYSQSCTSRSHSEQYSSLCRVGGSFGSFSVVALEGSFNDAPRKRRSGGGIRDEKVRDVALLMRFTAGTCASFEFAFDASIESGALGWST